MFQRAARHAARRSARPLRPPGMRAGDGLGSVKSLGTRPGKTLNVAHGVLSRSAAIGVASTVG